jgi:phosphatidylserine/phosphatidylglycerophosphate/cardiolipin synthase-like enzyme
MMIVLSRRSWFLILSALFVLAALSCQLDTGPVVTQLPPPDGGGEAPVDWYQIYFSEPVPSGGSLRGGPDQALAEAIRAARLSVDLAVLRLDLWSLRDALIDAQRRGLTVRIVTESDYLDGEEIQELIEAGIPVLGDRREGLMHNKFAVIDRQEVWTGSMNFTINGAYRNDNNLVRIRSSKLAENYTVEFEEMFVDDHFGPGSPANTPSPSFGLDSTLLEVYFSPDDGVAARLLELIGGANESVYFLAYSFTSGYLAEALIERAAAGVSVAGVLDESQYKSNTYGQYDRLREAGLEVRLDGNPRSMHHKVLIIDEEIVVTGSYNFSKSAETRNDENTLVIHRPDVAAIFLSEFKDIWAEAQE